MAKSAVSREAGATGRLISCFFMVYCHLAATNKHSDEAKAEEPPSLPPSQPPPSNPESLTVTVHDSASDTSTGDLPPHQPPAGNDNDRNQHPVIGIMREQELGKATLLLAGAIAMATLNSKEEKLAQSKQTSILIALSVGCAAIWCGILLRETFPKAAQVLEPSGIALVVSSYNGVMAFLLPAEFLWVPVVCIGLSLLPFAIVAWGRISLMFHGLFAFISF